MIELLDVGGEGRLSQAVNLNPSRLKTLGTNKGKRIPWHLPGRADAIPLPRASVRVMVMERTPLLRASIAEIQRVVVPGGWIILRHHASSADPHRVATEVLGRPIATAFMRLGSQPVKQSVFRNRREKGRKPYRAAGQLAPRWAEGRS